MSESDLKTCEKPPYERPNLSLVAQLSGCSVSLVSKVLSGRMGTSSVRPELRERIQEAARSVNFVPSSSARSFTKGLQGCYAVLIHRFDNTTVAGRIQSLIDGVCLQLAENNQKMMLRFFQNDEELSVILRTMCHPSYVDGVLFIGVNSGRTGALLVENMHRFSLPIVSICNDGLSPEIPNFGLRQYEVGRLAAEHLLSCGCRLPLLVQAPADETTRERERGFCEALADAGREFLPEQIVRLPGYGTEGLFTALSNLLVLRRTASFCWDGVVTNSDQQALGVIQFLEHKGIRIPEEVQILGIDNSPLCEYVTPALSSISGGNIARARSAIDLLEKLATRQTAEKTAEIYTTPQVVVRATTCGNHENK